MDGGGSSGVGGLGLVSESFSGMLQLIGSLVEQSSRWMKRGLPRLKAIRLRKVRLQVYSLRYDGIPVSEEQSSPNSPFVLIVPNLFWCFCHIVCG